MCPPSFRGSDGPGGGKRPKPRRRPRTRRRTQAVLLKKGRLDLEPVAADLPEDLVLLEHFPHIEEGHARLNLFRAAASAEGPDTGMDEAEHVQFRDQIRHPPLRKWADARLAGELAIR